MDKVFVRQLKSFLAEFNLSLNTAGKELGVSKGTLSGILSGRGKPMSATYQKKFIDSANAWMEEMHQKEYDLHHAILPILKPVSHIMAQVVLKGLMQEL